MTGLAGDAPATDAIEQVRELLRPDVDEPRLLDGYLDFLGEVDPLGTHVSHRVFHTKTLPRIYERWWRPFFERTLFGWSGRQRVDERAILLEMVDLGPGARALDVGCGPGNCTRMLTGVTDGGLVVGFDAAAKMLAAAAAQGGGENLAYVRGDAQQLPFPDGVFDGVSCVAAIHMFEDPMAALDEMTRVLAPGGCVALLASCNWRKKKRPKKRGMYVFERDELTSALADRGFVEIKQVVAGRAQFVGARKPANS